MKPRWHFILKTLLLLSGCLVALLIVLYLLSLALFVLDKNDLWFVPSFGFKGVVLFIFSLPWLVIFTVIVFLVILHVLVRHYAFAYQQPLLYSAVGIVLIVIAGSCIIRKTGLHQEFSDYSQVHHMPLAAPMYQQFEFQKNDRIHRGIIIEIRDPNFVLQDHWQEVWDVRVTPSTRFPQGLKFFVGQRVMVVGDRREQGVDAFGVRSVHSPREL